MKKNDFVPKQLESKAALYKQRNAQYGDTYKMQGAILEAMFPNGVSLDGIDDQNRYSIFITIVSKMLRYANNFDKGGHEDSLDDISVYAMMLKELDNDL